MFCHVTHYHTLSTQMGKPSQGEVCMYLSKVFYAFVMVVKCIFLFRDVIWMPNKTKLKFDQDQASAVELKWLCIVCGCGLDISSLCGNSQSFPLALDTVSMPGSVVPMAMFAQTIWWWNEQHIKLWEGKSNSAVWTISGMKLHLMLLNYKISIYEVSNE